MDQVLLEAAYSIETARSPKIAWERLIDVLARLKLDKVIYATRSDTTPADWHILSTLVNNWPQELSADPDFSEPFVTYCCATFEPSKVGSEYLPINDHYIDDYTREYIENIKRFGWTTGIGIPTSLKGSGRHGGFIMGNAMTRYDFERAIMPRVDELRTLCLITNKQLQAERGSVQHNITQRPLSPRETQTLELLSKGLRPKFIANELGLKESSIRLYIKNARAKLGAANNQDAVALFTKRDEL